MQIELHPGDDKSLDRINQTRNLGLSSIARYDEDDYNRMKSDVETNNNQIKRLNELSSKVEMYVAKIYSVAVDLRKIIRVTAISDGKTNTYNNLVRTIQTSGDMI